MKSLTVIKLFVLIGLLLLVATAVRAQIPNNAQSEVSFLLGYMEGSGCAFFRNGSWHDAKAAQQHLRDKFNYLVASDDIHSAEDFIDKAATKSSLSGIDYQVKCGVQDAMPSSKWLNLELQQLRSY